MELMGGADGGKPMWCSSGGGVCEITLADEAWVRFTDSGGADGHEPTGASSGGEIILTDEVWVSFIDSPPHSIMSVLLSATEIPSALADSIEALMAIANSGSSETSADVDVEFTEVGTKDMGGFNITTLSGSGGGTICKLKNDQRR